MSHTTRASVLEPPTSEHFSFENNDNSGDCNLGISVEECPKSGYINIVNFDNFQTELELHLSFLLHSNTMAGIVQYHSKASAPQSQETLYLADSKSCNRIPSKTAHKRKLSGNEHTPRGTLASHIQETLSLTSIRLSVQVQDLLNHHDEQYHSLSRAGALFHYYINPMHSRIRGTRLGQTDRRLLMRMPGSPDKVSVQLNGATNTYSGLVVQDRHSTGLHHLAIDSRLPQTSLQSDSFIADQLASEVAATHGDTHGFVFASGYVANMVSMVAISTERTVWLLDGGCHNSMFVAARASGASKVTRFPHGDYKQLETKLKAIDQDKLQDVIVGIEGLYSMEGTFPDLEQIQSLKDKYGFKVFCDECHSILTVGSTGGGILEYMLEQGTDTTLDPTLIDMRTGGFSKSAGAIGGYVTTSNNTFAALIRQHLGTLQAAGEEYDPLFLNGLVQCLYNFRRRALFPNRLARLWDMSNFVRAQLQRAGFTVFGDVDSPILGVHVGRLTVVAAMEQAAADMGLAIVPVTPPAVSSVRVRLCLNAMLTDADVGKLVRIMIRLGCRFGLIPSAAGKRDSPLYAWRGPVTGAEEEDKVNERSADSVAATLEAAEEQSLEKEEEDEEEKKKTYPAPSEVAVKQAGLAALERYGLGTGSARWLIGNHDAHIKLEATVRQCFGGDKMQAVLFGESRLAQMSLAHALTRPINGVSEHVILRHKSCSQAVFEGCASARRSEGVRFKDYDFSVDVLREVLGAGKRTAFTVFMDSASLFHGDCKEKSRKFAALIQLLGGVAGRQTGQKHRVTVVLYDFYTDFQGDGAGLGFMDNMDLQSLSRGTGIDVIVYGSFRALNLPGAFAVGASKPLMDELRWSAPGYCKSISSHGHSFAKYQEC